MIFVLFSTSLIAAFGLKILLAWIHLRDYCRDPASFSWAMDCVLLFFVLFNQSIQGWKACHIWPHRSSSGSVCSSSFPLFFFVSLILLNTLPRNFRTLFESILKIRKIGPPKDANGWASLFSPWYNFSEFQTSSKKSKVLWIRTLLKFKMFWWYISCDSFFFFQYLTTSIFFFFHAKAKVGVTKLSLGENLPVMESVQIINYDQNTSDLVYSRLSTWIDPLPKFPFGVKTIGVDLLYNGNVSIVVEAKLALGTTVTVTLNSSLLRGQLAVSVRSSPAQHLNICFIRPPEIEVDLWLCFVCF